MKHPVLQLMRERKTKGSRPKERDDGNHLALVVEGGAMRGVVSAGMICALEKMGFRDSFDSIWATSVGVITGAYFIAGQSELGTSTYLDDLRDSRFLSMRRILKGEPPLSLEYAYDELTHITKPLAVDAVLKSPISLHPIAACLESGRAEDLSDFVNGEDLRKRFKAASCMPFLAGPAVEIAGKHYYDGGIIDSLPYRMALASGATHVLVLHSWPLGIFRKEPPRIEKAVANFILRRHSRSFARAYQTRIRRYNKDLLELRRKTYQATPPWVFSASPGKDAMISHLERKREEIIKARESGISTCRTLLLDKQ